MVFSFKIFIKNSLSKVHPKFYSYQVNPPQVSFGNFSCTTKCKNILVDRQAPEISIQQNYRRVMILKVSTDSSQSHNYSILYLCVNKKKKTGQAEGTVCVCVYLGGIKGAKRGGIFRHFVLGVYRYPLWLRIRLSE